MPDLHTIRITAENNKNKNVFNILNADVYDVIIDKKMTTSSTLKNNSSNSLMKSSNNIITDNAEDFNPDVKEHEDDRNLLMVHATKEYNIDSILEFCQAMPDLLNTTATLHYSKKSASMLLLIKTPSGVKA